MDLASGIDFVVIAFKIIEEKQMANCLDYANSDWANIDPFEAM